MESEEAPTEILPAMPGEISGIAVGKTVHYVMPESDNQARHLAACIVKDWHSPNGMCNLLVFHESPLPSGSVQFWIGSVPYSDKKELNTWHWIEDIRTTTEI